MSQASRLQFPGNLLPPFKDKWLGELWQEGEPILDE
jgi:hypothetical protein